MDWHALQDNKCPACETDIYRGILESYCIAPDCDFHIRNKRLAEILEGLENEERDIWEEEDWSGYPFDD